MSYEVVITYRCDGCGLELEGKSAKSVSGYVECRSRLDFAMRRDGWVDMLTGGKPKRHFCKACADKPDAGIRRLVGSGDAK